MKLPGYLLAFYLILLAAIPCCAFDCPEEEEKLCARENQAATHEKSEDACGTCSPFFSCEGCATATISYEPAALEIAAIKITSVYTTYIQIALPTIDYDFWQPPKITA